MNNLEALMKFKVILQCISTTFLENFTHSLLTPRRIIKSAKNRLLIAYNSSLFREGICKYFDDFISS